MTTQFTFDVEKAAELLLLISNEARLQVLELLLENEWDVNSLAARVQLSQSSLSQHLKKLRDGKLVKTRRASHMVYYSCDNPNVAKLLTAVEACQVPPRN